MPGLRAEGECLVEVIPQQLPGAVKVNYYVTEVGGVQPHAIVGQDQEVEVVVKVEFSDAVRRFLCGNLCIHVDVDTCGPTADLDLGSKTTPLDPCGSGSYELRFRIAPDTLKAGDCGRVYCICVTVGSTDSCEPPGPGLVWGFCEEVCIAVRPAVPPAPPAPTAIGTTSASSS